MAGVAPHERLRRARAERLENLSALSARTGVRVHHLCAIEEGRFSDLPPGIYGRAAIRSFAAAYGLDSAALLVDCEALLPTLPDPIDALSRVRGGAHLPRSAGSPVPPMPARPSPGWRPLAAAALDAAIVGVLLLVVSVGAALVARVPIAALSSSSISLALVGLVLGGGYFVWFGGLGGATAGEAVFGLPGRGLETAPLTLREIAVRTCAAVARDARAIGALGDRSGRGVTPAGAARSVRPRELSPSPPPRPDRAEAPT